MKKLLFFLAAAFLSGCTTVNTDNAKRLNAVHSIVCSVPDNVVLGYFGWPSVAKLKDGTIVAAASGFRATHICACGKSVLFTSKDNGETWDAGQIINDSVADDRDTGLLELADGRLLLTWFASDIRVYINEKNRKYYEPTFPVLETLDEKEIAANIGSFIRFRNPDGTWSKRQQVLASAPHGPIQLKNGNIFYLGSRFGRENADGSINYKMGDSRAICAIKSSDGGKTWQTLSVFGENTRLCEPHAIELDDGSIIGHLREDKTFSIQQVISTDGGKTWSKPQHLAFGSPPHLMRHSSGVLICSYGWRRAGYGQRVMFSTDNGKTWSTDWIIRDDGENYDLGYPCTIELDDGSLLTVYYQHLPGRKHAAILASKWRLPDLGQKK